MEKDRMYWLFWIALVGGIIGALDAGWMLSARFNPGGNCIGFIPPSECLHTAHSFFMVLGCGVFMTLAVNAQRILPFTRDGNRLSHALIHTVAIICVVTASVLMFVEKVAEQQPHFNNVHAQLGLGLVSLLVLTYISALFIIYFIPMKARTRIWLIPYHRFLGFALYVTCMGQQLMGIWEKQVWNSQNPADHPVKETWIQLMLAISLVLGLWSSVFNIYHRNAPLGVNQVAEMDSSVSPLLN